MWRTYSKVATARAPHSRSISIAVIGSGPAGWYTAKYALQLVPNAHITMLEALPYPHGLARYGVAPDHASVKSCINDFEQVAAHPQVTWLGNVRVGDGVSLQDVTGTHHAVVFAAGAEGDRELGIPGEAGPGVWAARSFVQWYNGHPASHDSPAAAALEQAVQQAKRVVIVGAGNVAVDCARLLHKPAEELQRTDIMPAATQALCAVPRHVSIVARRGHVQAAWTIKELRELTRLPGCPTYVCAEEMSASETDASVAEMQASRASTRIGKLMREQRQVPAAQLAETEHSSECSTALRFLLAPAEVLRDDTGAVTGLRCSRTRLVGDAGAQRAQVDSDAPTVDIPADLVLRSVGYAPQPIPGCPWDDKARVVPTLGARVCAPSRERSTAMPGVYAAGWIKRGPSGIIGTNILDARAAADALAEDVAAGELPADGANDGADLLLSRIAARDPDAKVMTWENWLAADAAEREAGLPSGAERIKFASATFAVGKFGTPAHELVSVETIEAGDVDAGVCPLNPRA